MKTVHDQHYARIIERLRTRRIALGQDQATVAAKLGYTDRWLSKVERRDVRLDILTFMRLAHALGLRAHRLIRKAEEGLGDTGPFAYVSQSAMLLPGTSGWPKPG
jgi:transcriptional regulator with XRE-family HTH domain